MKPSLDQPANCLFVLAGQHNVRDERTPANQDLISLPTNPVLPHIPLV
jgi:hypothetical protein